MSRLGNLEAGSRHDLLVGLSPDAPDAADFRDDGEGAFGYVHSYESSSRYDGPGLRMVLFVSGCLLRCSYCHNPDTWHLKRRDLRLCGTRHQSPRHVRGPVAIA